MRGRPAWRRKSRIGTLPLLIPAFLCGMLAVMLLKASGLGGFAEKERPLAAAVSEYAAFEEGTSSTHPEYNNDRGREEEWDTLMETEAKQLHSAKEAAATEYGAIEHNAKKPAATEHTAIKRNAKETAAKQHGAIERNTNELITERHEANADNADEHKKIAAADASASHKRIEQKNRSGETTQHDVQVRVYLTAEDRIETVPLETYVRGVVAGEVPAEFEPEALKAQAIAARTYIVRKMLAASVSSGDGSNANGLPEYDVTDTAADQVYIPLDKLMTNWSNQEEAERSLERIERAVAETEGVILTYEDEPIEALYFSTSSGFTENAEDYWSMSAPYLTSVPSPWDALLSPRYEQTIEMELEDFYKRLGIGKRERKGGIELLSRTEGRSVKEIRIGKRTFTGRQVREALDLPSANFDWRLEGDRIVMTTYGYGHGVGMSQWGAQALAQAGNDAEQILAYYYRGAELTPSARFTAAFERFKT